MKQAINPRSVVVAAMIVLSMSAASCKRESSNSSRHPQIVASFFPLYDFARALAGTNFHVVCHTPPGGDPHAMEASPQLARSVAEAELVLLLGLGMDGWVEKLAANERKTRISVASLGIAPKRVGKSVLGAFTLFVAAYFARRHPHRQLAHIHLHHTHHHSH